MVPEKNGRHFSRRFKDAYEAAWQANFERIQKGNSVNNCVNKAATA
jgi:hypothetical protein